MIFYPLLLRIFPNFRILYKSPFASKFSWKKRSSHQGKKEVACIESKPLVSCLWGCGESVNPPTSRRFRAGHCPVDHRETQAHYPFFFYFCEITLLYLKSLHGVKVCTIINNHEKLFHLQSFHRRNKKTLLHECWFRQLFNKHNKIT